MNIEQFCVDTENQNQRVWFDSECHFICCMKMSCCEQNTDTRCRVYRRVCVQNLELTNNKQKIFLMNYVNFS